MPKFSFGRCRRCNSPIKIPGLEASLCSASCGWVREKSWGQLDAEAQGKKSRSRKGGDR